MKKRFFLILFLFIGSPGFIFSAQTFDTIVLLDTSESMFGYFDSSVDYLIQDIIKNQLRQGDTFHLISFADVPEYEISKKIITSKDVESILSRILLLKPLGKYTDLISALEYLNKYAGSLSPAARKRIIILTDGIHDPPPSTSPMDENEVIEKVKLITENMKRQGWEVSLIRFPLSGAVSGFSGGKTADKPDTELSGNAADAGTSTSGSAGTSVDLFPELSRDLKTDIIEYDTDNTALSHKATGAPLILFPENLGEVGRSFTIPFSVRNYLPRPVQVKLKGIIAEGTDILKDEVMIVVKGESTSVLNAEVELPSSYSPGEYELPVDLVFPDDTRPYPRKGVVVFTLSEAGSFSSSVMGFALKIIMYIVFVAAAVFILFLLFKRLYYGIAAGSGRGSGIMKAQVSGSSNLKVSPAVSTAGVSDKKGSFSSSVPDRSSDRPPAADKKRAYTHSRNAEDGRFFEMLVRNQNRHVGFRNIHLLEEGSPLTVGGSGSDDYLIFIYPVDRHIAEIELRNGVPYLKPVKKEFFPGITSDTVRLDSKEISVMSLDSVLFAISFREWISPAERINKILHLIDRPGLPDFDY